MLYAQAAAAAGSTLASSDVYAALAGGLAGRFSRRRVLVLIPDHTRSLPLPILFRMVTDILRDTACLDFMVALGTHPALDDRALCRLVGITLAERASAFANIGLFNHNWSDPDALTQIGTLSSDRVRELAGPAWHPSLGGDVPVRINRRILDYDHILILGPTFPHEVAGFSGGAKYLFPGISGPEMINVTHWLGALITIMQIIGTRSTPVRAIVHAAAELVPTPITLASLVVQGEHLAGVFVGDYLAAFQAAAELSSRVHIRWLDQPVQRVLSWAPPMYDELWTAAKAVYKLEPVVADGGEIVVYAPHLDTVSHVHGAHIYRMGYHVRDYFLSQWDRFKDTPLGVLAHSTHVKGAGVYVDGIERPRIRVTLASRISADDCARLNLGYLDPDTVNPDAWRAREAGGTLFVPRAGEILYRLRA